MRVQDWGASTACSDRLVTISLSIGIDNSPWLSSFYAGVLPKLTSYRDPAAGRKENQRGL